MSLASEQSLPEAQTAPARNAMGFTVDSRSVGDVVVVYCKGRMDLGEGLQELADQVRMPLQSGSSVLLHLGEVETIDAAGLGVLAELAAQAAGSERELRLCNVPKKIADVISLTRLAEVMECYPTEKDGLASYLGLAAFWRAS
jgi:anti-anti-sigma factor